MVYIEKISRHIIKSIHYTIKPVFPRIDVRIFVGLVLTQTLGLITKTRTGRIIHSLCSSSFNILTWNASAGEAGYLFKHMEGSQKTLVYSKATSSLILNLSGEILIVFARS